MKKLALFALMIAGSHVAFGSVIVTVTFTALPGTFEGATHTSTNATYNGGATATINGTPNVNLVCDDFVDTTYMPSPPLSFNVETIGSLPGALFTSGFAPITEGSTAYTLTQTQAYDTAAVLTANLEAIAVTPANANAITDYQYALWDLFKPGATDPATGFVDNTDPNVPALLVSAFASVLAPTTAIVADEQALVIYTPTGASVGNQEFLGLSTPTPEPASWILLSGLGLLLMLPRLIGRKVN